MTASIGIAKEKGEKRAGQGERDRQPPPDRCSREHRERERADDEGKAG